MNTANGTQNVAIGNLSLKENINGNQNTAIGMGSLNSATEGDANTALGLSSGSDLTGNSNYNTFIGALSGVNSSNINGSSALGFNAKVGTSYTIRLGDEYVTKWSFGLPTTDTGNAIQVGDDTTNGNGASLTSAGVWTNASSILFKTNFIELDNDWILDKINSISVKKWDYKNTNETHIGPTSEEFITTFGVGNGNDTSHLGTIDVSGVALKGVQALYEKINKQNENINLQNKTIESQKNKIEIMELEILELKTAIEKLITE